jgi:phosphatidylglycerophosphate synthase
VIRHLPNILSIWRILSAPLILVCSLLKLREHFLVFLIIAIVTDFFDGYLARRFSLESNLGSKLDTFGDLAIFTVLPFCVYLLWPKIVFEEIMYIVIAVSSIVIPLMFGVLKYKKIISFHTDLSKLSFFVMSFSVCILLMTGYNGFFHIAVFIQLISGLELFFIVLTLSENKNRIKSFISLINKK